MLLRSELLEHFVLSPRDNAMWETNTTFIFDDDGTVTDEIRQELLDIDNYVFKTERYHLITNYQDLRKTKGLVNIGQATASLPESERRVKSCPRPLEVTT